ncbi:MAG: hypothetical protein LBG66_02650 [Gallionellaceae bacterium]|jgi:hypothetical protein|nr:hypothetical protein [Gallionellaceae bacterium]
MSAETINGVTFEEWASACGNMAQGMSTEKILEILGLEQPVWADTKTQWGKRLGELGREDMGWMTRYGRVFANPHEGRFASASSPAADTEALLKLVPDRETFGKISAHQSVAHKYGFDPVTILAGYGLDLGKWGAVVMHYMRSGDEVRALLASDPDGLAEEMEKNSQWEQHFEEMYAANKVDLGKDIGF